MLGNRIRNVPPAQRLNNPTMLIYTFWQLGDEESIKIIRDIADNKRPIKRLNLCKNNLTDMVVETIIECLINNKEVPLEDLDLSGNNFTKEAVGRILTAIEQRSDSCLLKLHLRGNPGTAGTNAEMLGRVEAVTARNALRMQENRPVNTTGSLIESSQPSKIVFGLRS